MGVPRRKTVDWEEAVQMAIAERDPVLLGQLIAHAEESIFDRRKNARPIDGIEEKELREGYKILLELRTENTLKK